MMPAGPVTGGAWQVREYHRRDAGTGLGMWAVLAGGFTSTVVIVALLLAGAAAAGLGPIPLLACAAGLLAVRRGWAVARPRVPAAAGPGLGRRRAPVLACTAAGLLADAGVLAACFRLAGLPVPWQGLLFAYAAGQLAGRLVPLPGGSAAWKAACSALTLTGTPPAAAAAAVIVYRVAGCWAVGAAWTAVAAAVARRSPGRPGPGRVPAASGQAAAVTVPGQPVHRPGGTVVPRAATEDSTPQAHNRVTPCPGPRS